MFFDIATTKNNIYTIKREIHQKQENAMLDLPAIQALLADRNAEAVARASGVNAQTVRSIRRDANPNPSWATVKALSDYLTGISGKEESE